MFGGIETALPADVFRGPFGFRKSLAKTSMNTFSGSLPRKRLEPDYVSGSLAGLGEAYNRKVLHNGNIFLQTARCSKSRSIRQQNIINSNFTQIRPRSVFVNLHDLLSSFIAFLPVTCFNLT
jgi:hypothetical protein